jgi:hypothetical protein
VSLWNKQGLTELTLTGTDDATKARDPTQWWADNGLWDVKLTPEAYAAKYKRLVRSDTSDETTPFLPILDALVAYADEGTPTLKQDSENEVNSIGAILQLFESVKAKLGDPAILAVSNEEKSSDAQAGTVDVDLAPAKAVAAAEKRAKAAEAAEKKAREQLKEAQNYLKILLAETSSQNDDDDDDIHQQLTRLAAKVNSAKDLEKRLQQQATQAAIMLPPQAKALNSLMFMFDRYMQLDR